MIRQRFKVLEQLLGCYFHQDWSEEYDGDALALQAIVKSEPKDQRAVAVSEIDVLLAMKLSETELRLVLIEQIGCYFEPSSKGISCLEWLKQVRHAFGTCQ